jgi:lipoic acid synthetase
MVTLIDTLTKKPSELRHPEKQNRPESASAGARSTPP